MIRHFFPAEYYPRKVAVGTDGVLGVNQYAAGTRRDLSEAEQQRLAAARKKLLPKIFKSYKTPAERLMYSPLTDGALCWAASLMRPSRIRTTVL